MSEQDKIDAMYKEYPFLVEQNKRVNAMQVEALATLEEARRCNPGPEADWMDSRIDESKARGMLPMPSWDNLPS